jgi:hypothetical protein
MPAAICGVDDAAQRQLARQVRVGHDVVDPRGQRLHQPQLRAAARAGRAAEPAHGDVNVVERTEVRAQTQVDARMQLGGMPARYCMSSVSR